MSPEEATIEALRRWSQILLWVSIILPSIGALAVGARFYVERHEKRLTVRLTSAAISQAKEEASTARTEVADARQKQQEAEKALRESLTKVENSATEANRAAAEIIERQRPRMLSGVQSAKLTAALIGSPKPTMVEVACSVGDEEGCQYAEQLRQALTSAGWPTSESVGRTAFARTPVGVRLVVSREGTAPPPAQALADAFQIVGVQVDPRFDNSLAEGRYRLLVGTKPR